MYKKISFYSRPFPRIDSYRKMIDLAAEYGMTGLEGYYSLEFGVREDDSPKLDEFMKIVANEIK